MWSRPALSSHLLVAQGGSRRLASLRRAAARAGADLAPELDEDNERRRALLPDCVVAEARRVLTLISRVDGSPASLRSIPTTATVWRPAMRSTHVSRAGSVKRAPRQIRDRGRRRAPMQSPDNARRRLRPASGELHAPEGSPRRARRGRLCPVGEALVARTGAHVVAPPHQEHQSRSPGGDCRFPRWRLQPTGSWLALPPDLDAA
jgi:hypothetical protein